MHPPLGKAVVITRYSGFLLLLLLVPVPNGRIPLYFLTEDGNVSLVNLSIMVESEVVLPGTAKFLHYDWIFARYWEPPENYLLEFEGPYGRAFAYDYGDPAVREERAREIIDYLIANNYSGVFFDWFAALCDPGQEYLEEFERRHPGLTPREALLAFISELREEGKRRGLDVIVVSNQAYRCGAEVMAAVDWDISESYFTEYSNVTRLLPWETNNWESPATYVPVLVENTYREARRINPRLGFTHLNYGDTREAAFYALAGARVFGHDGTLEDPIEANLYWLGCYLGMINSSRWAIGLYDAAIVAAGEVPFRVPVFRGSLAYDLKEGTWVELDTIGQFGPWGNVYLLPQRHYRVLCGAPVLEGTSKEALEVLARLGGCVVVEGNVTWDFEPPSVGVSIVANDVDWNLSGRLLAEALAERGIGVERAEITPLGLKRALLDSALVIILGGRESPVIGELLEGFMGVETTGPGRRVVWLWGDDRYGTRARVLEELNGTLALAENLTSPLPRCGG